MTDDRDKRLLIRVEEITDAFLKGEAPLLGQELAHFSRGFETAIDYLTMLCKYISDDYEIAFSLDLCELVDGSMSQWELKVHAKQLGPILQRRVFRDSYFARKAIEAITAGSMPFTILPGTAIEILLFLNGLRRRYTDFVEGRLKPKLSFDHGEGVDRTYGQLSNKDLADAFQQFEEALEQDRAQLGLANRLTDNTLSLLAQKNFLHPCKFRHGLDINLNVMREFTREIGRLGRRRRDPMSDEIDALNLALAVTKNMQVDGEADNTFLIHITRTPTLLSLIEFGSVDEEATLTVEEVITQELSSNQRYFRLPLVCPPQLAILFHLLFRGRKPPKDAWERAKSLRNYWHKISGRLESLDFELTRRRRSVESIKKAAIDVNEAWRGETTESESKDVIRKYMRMFRSNAGYAEQLRCDRFYDGADEVTAAAQTAEQIRQAKNLQLHDQLMVILDILRDRDGVPGGVRLVRAATEKSQIEYDNVTVISEKDFVVVVRNKDGEFPWKEFLVVGQDDTRLHHKEAALRGVHASIAVGFQRFDYTSEVRGIVFWPATASLLAFLTALGNSFERSSEKSSRLTVVGIRGELKILSVAVSELKEPERVLARLPIKPLVIVQVAHGDEVCTWESLDEGRESFCSVRIKDKPPIWVKYLYDRLYGVLTTEEYESFIGTYLMGNGSKVTE